MGSFKKHLTILCIFLLLAGTIVGKIITQSPSRITVLTKSHRDDDFLKTVLRKSKHSSLYIPFDLQLFAGATHYIRAGASGNDSGDDWTNAYPSMPSSLTRGDTYYIADGSYGGYNFDDAESGSDYIYLLKATSSDHGTETGWNSAYGDGQAVFGQMGFYTGYWDISGQQRGADWISGYGIKADSGGKGFRAQASGLSNIYLRYLENEGAGEGGTPGNDGVYFHTNNPGPLVVQYCYLHDYNRIPIYIGSSGTDNVTIEYCYIARNRSTPEYHAEGMWYSGGDHLTVRYNYLVDLEGTGILMVHTVDDVDIYGNIAWMAREECQGVQHGFAATWDDSYVVTNIRVHHNTVIDYEGLGTGIDFIRTGSTYTGTISYNNLFYNCQNVVVECATHDYNAFWDGNARGEANAQTDIDSSYFQDYSNKDFRLTKATNPGYAVGSPYNYDLDGNLRSDYDRGAFEYVSGGGGGGEKLVMILAGA